jgi:hypothetical protein
MDDKTLANLAANVHLLDADGQTFAGSLLLQLNNKGQLNDKQMYWLGILAERVERAQSGVPDFTAQIDVGNFGGVVALFKKAGQSLKYPKMNLQLPGGQRIMLAMAGSGSKYPGHINVTDGGGYNNNIWFGRISPDGKWMPSKSVDQAKLLALITLLTALAKDPIKTAKAYGDITGHCCACYVPLTDPRSKTAGYGQVCAQKWGFPWGAVAPQFMAEAV